MRKFYKTWLITLLFMVSATLSCFASTKANTPDFAYPKQVIKNADKLLQKALAENNEAEALRALINLEIANVSISNERVDSMLHVIGGVTQRFTQPDTRALAQLLTANIYADVYNSIRYEANHRNIPLLPYADKVSLWSGDQFRERIYNLLDSALMPADALFAKSITSYPEIISIDRSSRVYYPTLYDFVAAKAIDMLKNISQTGSIFPLSRMCEANKFVQSSIFTSANRYANRIMQIYSTLLTHYADTPAPFINYDVDRIEYTEEHLFDTSSALTSTPLLQNLYDRTSGSEYSGLVLIQIYEDMGVSSDELNKWLYERAKKNLRSFPAFEQNKMLKDIVANIEIRSADLIMPNMVSPGQAFVVKATFDNLTSVNVDIYDVTSIAKRPYRSSIKRSQLDGLKPIKTLTINADGNFTVPYRTNATGMVTLTRPGVYVLVPSISSTKSRTDYYSTILCTNLAVSGLNIKDNTEVLVVNPFTGAPVDDAQIVSDNKGKLIGTTDKSGLMPITALSFHESVAAQKGTDRFSNSQYIYHYVRNDNVDIYLHTNIITDLALYHPGDTVKWAAVVYGVEKSGSEYRPHGNYPLEASLLNVNGQKVDSLSAVTDNFGRIEGKFTIPKDGLTGYANITIKPTVKNPKINFNYASKGIMVSDYKLPEFFIETATPAQGTPQPGAVTLSGTVKTYSGFPLEGSTVEVNLTANPLFRWWFGSHDEQFYATTTTTDEKGGFTFVFDKTLLEESPCPDGMFIAKITATSSTGESQTATAQFTVSNAYAIDCGLVGNFDITGDNGIVPISVKVLNNKREEIHTGKLLMEILANDTTILSSQLDIAKPVADLSKLKSGTYNFVFKPIGFKADSIYRSEVVCYRPTDKDAPSDKLLWTPKQYADFSGHNIELLYSTSKPDENLLVSVFNEHGSLLSREWITMQPGMHRYATEVPDSCNQVVVSMLTFHHMKAAEIQCNFTRKASVNTLRIKRESFRDKLMPGSLETWKFTIAVDNMETGTAPTQAAVIMNMYNKALDQITPYNLSFEGYTMSHIQSDYRLPQFGNISTYFRDRNRESGISFSRNFPIWVLYGQQLYGNSIRIRGSQPMMARGNSLANSLEGEVMGLAVFKSEAKMSYASADDALLEEAVTTDAGGAPVNDSDENGSSEQSQEFAYRDSEVASALFKPMLTTNDKGELEVAFTVPNANTTWAWKAVAYNTRMLVATDNAELLANKPVMVAPNLPRFVRHGDRILLKALVMNNSDSTQNITTTIELFNPLDGAIIASEKCDTTLEAGRSASADIFATAGEGQFMGYRVKSSTADFADGEQALIPILPSEQMVVESTPFYLVPDSSDFTIQLPTMPANARVTLQYCENPIWYVVTALPGLAADDMSTPYDAANAIFSAVIAEKLLDLNPQIGEAIEMWSSSDKSDGMLRSMLQKNEDLKIVLLNSTPWVAAAASDTERMTRLALLLDRSNISLTIKKAVATLDKLAAPNGGWRWIAQMDESSQWATESALSLFGHLNRLGYMPADKRLNSMVNQAVKYIDQCVTKEYKRYPKSDFLGYTFMRSAFPAISRSTTVQSIIAKTVQNSVSGWKKASLFNKGIMAILLTENKYPSVARQIMNSVSEFAETSPTKGMWWPSLADSWFMAYNDLGVTALLLEAYEAVKAPENTTDGIRQWLILQKETRNWGSQAPTSTVLADILGHNPRWLSPAQGSDVTIGGTPLVVDNVEKFTGQFSSDISGMNPSGATLRIAKHADTPAWGAVICQYTQNMTEIKPHSCDDLSITKNLYRAVTTPDGVKWEIVEELKVGDRVKVELVINCGRTMDYVTVVDNRPACFEPVEQLPKPIWAEGLCFYRENRNSATNIFVGHMPKGDYRISYEMFVNNAGEFTSGIATIQSQYAPQFTATSAALTRMKITSCE